LVDLSSGRVKVRFVLPLSSKALLCFFHYLD
jgi:hypothetical protein